MNGLVRVGSVDARLAPFRWAWAEGNAEAIAEHWARRKADRPALFNGRVLMVSDIRLDGDTAAAQFFATDYAGLLAWVDWGFPDASVANGFAMGALVGSDGGYLLGRMAAHTANAGRLYFPCGTPDLSDVGDGQVVDLRRSLMREIEEETGLDETTMSLGNEWIVVRHEGLIAFMRIVRLPIPADEAQARIARHLAADPGAELVAIEVVRPGDDLDEAAMPGVLPIFLRDAFAREMAQR